MSDSQQYEQVTVSSNGVTVDKRFEENEFPVPAIAFDIQSSRTVTVMLTLTDGVPDGVSVEDLGFHPEYGSEYWTIDEEEITFEREIEANSSYTTVYGIRATGTDNVEQFLSEPTIQQVDPPLEEETDGVVDDSDVVRDVISGNSDSVPGLEDEGDDVETLDLKDPNEPDEPGDSSDSASSSGSASGDSSNAASANGTGDALPGADIDAGTLCGALATEIRDGNVDEEDVKLLRKAFDLAAEDTGSVEARIQRLQADVADLRAYTGTLEAFLDENGTGQEIIDGLREDVEEFQSEIESVRSLAEGHEDSLSSLEDRVGSMQTTVDDLEDEVGGIDTQIDTVSGDVDKLRDEVSELDDIRADLDDLDGVRDEVDDLESQVGDIDVEAIESDVDDIEAEIEKLKEWREQLSSVIGGE